jgi:hypothetical protein
MTTSGLGIQTGILRKSVLRIAAFGTPNLDSEHPTWTTIYPTQQHTPNTDVSGTLNPVTQSPLSPYYKDNIWKYTGFPKAIILDHGPQFTAQVIQELWRKLRIKQKLSIAFHPQTDGESK